MTSKRRSTTAIVLTLLATALAILLCIDRSPADPPTGFVAHVESLFHAPASPPTKPARKVYGYSVVPGGVQTGDALAKLMSTDPILNVWFGACDQAVTYDTMPQDADVFTTFRRDSSIRWSQKRIHVKLGEPYMNRCGHLILLRCGNEINWHPQVPSAPVDPTILESTAPPVEPPLVLTPSDTVTTTTGGSTPPGGSYPPTGGYPCCGGGGYPPPPGGPTPPPTHVPEPSTLVLLFAGLLALALIVRK